ncbi:hypothetical protein ACFWD1_07080 [Micromonospora chalcea]
MKTTHLRAICLAFAALTSTLIAIGGGVLSHLAGDNTAQAMITAAAAFAAAMALALSALAFLFKG